ncbi:MAG: T9SS type A sorting domain-containing protein, partial [Bacteroidetes bacterium]|nr:T9SS type A sorting domain-containing protein [Bacteroidota bacterium]
GNDQTVCSSTTVNLDGGSWPAGYALLWNTGDTSQIITVNSAGNYQLKVTTPGNGCSDSDQVQITYINRPSGATINKGTLFNGQYSNGTLSNPDGVCTGNTVTYEFLPPTNYTNADYGTKWILIGTPVFMTAQGYTPASATYSIVLPSANNGIITFTPTTNEIDSIYTLWLTIKDSISGCDTNIARTIKVNGPPVLSMADNSVCPGNVAVFSPGIFASYIWNDGSTNSTLNTSIAGTYWVTVTDLNGCQNTDTAELKNYAPASVNLGQDQSICTGTSTILDAGIANIYIWNNSISTRTNTVNTAGDYSVAITDSNGCQASDTVKVSLLPLPSASFTFTKTQLTANFTPVNTSYTKYQWNFGDGNQSSLTSPVHNYANFNAYTVSLKVTDNNNCSDTSSQNINLINGVNTLSNSLLKAEVYPNPFRENTTVSFELDKARAVEMMLYDVTGRKVFSSSSKIYNAGQNQIPMQLHAAGIYYLQLVIDGETYTFKLMSEGK